MHTVTFSTEVDHLRAIIRRLENKIIETQRELKAAQDTLESIEHDIEMGNRCDNCD